MSERVLLGEIAKSQTGPFGSQLHEEDYVEEGSERLVAENQQLFSLRDFLLPMLMNGQVKVIAVG